MVPRKNTKSVAVQVIFQTNPHPKNQLQQSYKKPQVIQQLLKQVVPKILLQGNQYVLVVEEVELESEVIPVVETQVVKTTIHITISGKLPPVPIPITPFITNPGKLQFKFKLKTSLFPHLLISQTNGHNKISQTRSQHG